MDGCGPSTSGRDMVDGKIARIDDGVLIDVRVGGDAYTMWAVTCDSDSWDDPNHY